MKYFFSFILLLLLSNNHLFSQKKFEIAGGLGFPDLLNFKLKYGNKFQLAAGVGPIFQIYKNEYNLKAVKMGISHYTADLYFHFAKSNDTIRYKYYWNNGVCYWPADLSHPSDYRKDIFFYSRFGRTFYLTKQVGINFDLGIMLDKYEQTSSAPLGGSILFPSLGGQLIHNEGNKIITSASLMCFFKF